MQRRKVRDENRRKSKRGDEKPRPTKMEGKLKSAEEKKMSRKQWTLLTYPDYNHPRTPNRIQLSVVSAAKPSLIPSADPSRAKSPELSRAEPRDNPWWADRAEFQLQQRASSQPRASSQTPSQTFNLKFNHRAGPRFESRGASSN